MKLVFALAFFALSVSFAYADDADPKPYDQYEARYKAVDGKGQDGTFEKFCVPPKNSTSAYTFQTDITVSKDPNGVPGSGEGTFPADVTVTPPAKGDHMYTFHYIRHITGYPDAVADGSFDIEAGKALSGHLGDPTAPKAFKITGTKVPGGSRCPAP